MGEVVDLKSSFFISKNDQEGSEKSLPRAEADGYHLHEGDREGEMRDSARDGARRVFISAWAPSPAGVGGTESPRSDLGAVW